jgi:hypothetical protein
MIDSVRRLLADLFDYEAPKQGAPDALSAFDAWAEETDSVRRILLTTAQATALPAQHGTEASIGFLAELPGSPAAWEKQLARDAEILNDTANRCSWLSIDAYEVELPKFLTLAQALKDLSGFQDADVFIELVADGSLEDSLGQLADAEWPLAKFRSGGSSSAASAQLAQFIHTSLALEIPFKLTGLLESPMSDGHGIGVLNAVGATALGIAHDLTRAEINDILLNTKVSDWRVGDESLSWCGLEAGTDDLDDARAMLDGISIQNPARWESELIRHFEA